MAGIGFEIRKILRREELTSIITAYVYAGALGAGPWLISILGILSSSFLARFFTSDTNIIRQYQVSVTYLIAISLILTGPIQLMLARYIADRVFEEDMKNILPNLIGALLLCMGGSFFLSFPIVHLLFKGVHPLFQVLFILCLTFLSGMWISNILLNSLKNYRYILFSFFISYLLILVLTSFFVRSWGLNGLLSAFFLGHLLLFCLLTSCLIYHYPSDKFIEFDFLKKERRYIPYLFTGLFYNLGIWIDKFIFWMFPQTGQIVIGPLRASMVYDVPIFLAYLAIVPGMAAFLVRLEADFAQDCDSYYSAIREGATLSRIHSLSINLARSIRTALLDIFMTQLVANVMIYMLVESLFSFFHLSYLYIPLFVIDSVGTFLQLIFMANLTVLFYFDRQKETAYLSFIFLVLNGIFSYLSIKLGPFFYGYGFVMAFLISNVIGFILVRRLIGRINYATFMLS